MRETPPWRGTLLVFLFFAALYTLTASGHLSTPDEELMFRTAEAIASRGELAVEPLGGFATRRGVDGREYAQYGLGNSVAAVPLYLLGSAAARLIDPADAERLLRFETTLLLPPGSPAGPELVKRFVVSFQGALIAAALCALVWRFAWRIAAGRRRILPQAEAPLPEPGSEAAGRERGRGLSPGGAAWLTALALGGGTMVWTHARTLFSEPLAALLMIASFYVATGRGAVPGFRRSLAAGAFFGLALLTRLDSLFLLPGLGLFLALRHLEEERPELNSSAEAGDRGPYVTSAAAGVKRLLARPFLLSALGAALPLVAAALFQMGLNKMLFGGATEVGHADQSEGIRFSTPLLAGLYGFLFSAGKSALLFSPALILGLAGWRAFGRRDLSLALGLGASALLALLLHSRWQNWSGGWDWGPRHIYQLHAFAMLPLAAYLAQGWSVGRRWFYAAVLVPAMAVQVYGTSQHPVDFYALYYRLPLTRPKPRLPMAVPLYGLDETLSLTSRLGLRDPETGSLREGTFWPPVAPINDSIYVPQNTVWYRYAEMWERGYTDNVWLRLWLRLEGEEQEIR